MSTKATKLPIIDADAHVVEPFDLWSERMPAEFQHLVWRRELDDDGRERLYYDGELLNIEWSTGTLSTPGAVQEGGRLDIDIETEVDEGVRDPHRRLALMDEQGIAVSVLFPSMMLGLSDMREDRIQVAYARVYNDWVAELCSTNPLRLKWGAVIPAGDIPAAVIEAERAISAGAQAVMVPPIFNKQHLSVADPALDGLHGLLAEAGVPLVVHAVNPHNRCLSIYPHLRGRVQWQMGYSFQNQLATMHVLDSDLFVRHPRLRIGFFEGDVGWVPHWFSRLDLTLAKMALVATRRETPVVNAFLRNCVMSGDMNDPQLAAAVDYLGLGGVLFASDWPHHDGTWPDPIVAIREHSGLTDAQKRDLLVDAPANFFGINIPELLARLPSEWSLDAPLATIPPLLRQGRGPAIDAVTTAATL
ncbi:amidohydrolase family protein [Williamsia serinedens]|uniref:Metal-dependent hydrolase, TIM-barrel fold n=1 Tax=Williamsia serinedens TaxID=391736 RepID=A0ABT1GXG9_9NOCA|nr:amidohydrolase family protein [Williamsia serinedens]MCP2159252.1 putative metal-dependent hydrolase, TIM-barrel fold [Williamsia serinedens]